MIGIVDAKVFDSDPIRHITNVAEIMLAGIKTIDQAGTNGLAAGGHEDAVADKNFSLPTTAIIGPQHDEGDTIDGRILYDQHPAANGINTHVPQGRVADGCIGNSHMSIETGQGA